jgi:hypothetical protein
MSRMRAEATAMGADGIVGVKLTINRFVAADDWRRRLLRQVLNLAAAFTDSRGRPPRENHLSLDHHCGKLSVGAVYRGL